MFPLCSYLKKVSLILEIYTPGSDVNEQENHALPEI